MASPELDWSVQVAYISDEPCVKFTRPIPADLEGENGRKIGSSYEKTVCIAKKHEGMDMEMETCMQSVTPDKVYGDRV